jgi:seryl-tRNA synthetase
MIDVKKLEENPNEYKTYLKNRNYKDNLVDNLLDITKERKSLLFKVENLRNQKKIESKNFGELKKKKEDTSKLEEVIKNIDIELKKLEENLDKIEVKYTDLSLNIPNILLNVPVGKSEEDNVVVRTWGKKPEFDFTPKDHVEIGEKLDIIDLKRASKVTGARFVFMKGIGAKIERALISFMLDTHSKNGYTEIMPPMIVNENSMLGTGQLPKFGEDLFKIEKFPFYLIPTAEVPVTNYFSNEILDEKDLPVKFAAFSSCYRSEAGSYGKDTKGIIRQHQFNKVELVKFTTEDTSEKEHEKLLNDAERILQLLNLHYRVVELCSADVSFSAAKCFDIEVWLPSENKYREISSCSNFLDFQARRAKIRYKDKNGNNKYVHTINGSGLAIGRTVIAIIEQYQTKDGFNIPEISRNYMK